MSKPLNGETPKCKSCGAMIVWVRMVPSMKPAPLDAVPTLTGNIERKRGKISTEQYGRVVPPAERKEGARLYICHFATCPNAGAHRATKG